MIYLYRNPLTGEIKEVSQKFDEEHQYEENSVKYDRVFTVPNMSVDTIIDPNSPKDFVKATNKKGTIGELWERSAELSDKRKGTSKVDYVKEQKYENYKKNVGKPHIDKLKQAAAQKLDKMGIIIEK